MGRFLLSVLALLGAAPAAAQARGDLLVSGHAPNNAVVVRATGTDSGSYAINGGRPHRFSGIRSLTIDGHGGRDVCRVINPPGGLLAPPGGIDCNGGNAPGQPRRGVLELRGGRSDSSSYRPGVRAGTGTIVHRLGRFRQLVRFTGLAPVVDTVPSPSVAVTVGSSANDTLALVNGSLSGSWEVESLAGSGFESDTFTNKQTVTVTATAMPNNTILIEPTAAETAVTSLNVNVSGAIVLAGAHAGAAPVSLTAGTTVTGSGFGTDLSAGGLAASAPDGIGPLTTDVGSLAAASSAGGVSISNAGSADLGSVASLPLTGITAEGEVSISARNAGASLQANHVISGSDVALKADKLSLSGGSVTATGQATFAPATAGTGMSLGASTTNAGDLSAASLAVVHAPIVAVGSAAAGAITVSAPIARPGGALELIGPAGFGAGGGGSLSAQSLTLDDVGSAGRPWTIGPSSIADGVGAAIPYSGVASLEVDGGSGSDTFDVTPSPGTTDQITGGGPSAAPGDSLSYEAGGRVVSGAALTPAGELDAAGVQQVGYAGIERVSVVDPGQPSAGAPTCSLLVPSTKVTIARSHKSGHLTVLAACDQPARAKLTGTVRIKGTRHGRHGSITVAPVSASLRSGTFAALTIKLPRAAVAALRAGASESLTLTLSATGAGGSGHATATVKKLTR